MKATNNRGGSTTTPEELKELRIIERDERARNSDGNHGFSDEDQKPPATFAPPTKNEIPVDKKKNANDDESDIMRTKRKWANPATLYSPKNNDKKYAAVARRPGAQASSSGNTQTHDIVQRKLEWHQPSSYVQSQQQQHQEQTGKALDDAERARHEEEEMPRQKFGLSSLAPASTSRASARPRASSTQPEAVVADTNRTQPGVVHVEGIDEESDEEDILFQESGAMENIQDVLNPGDAIIAHVVDEEREREQKELVELRHQMEVMELRHKLEEMEKRELQNKIDNAVVPNNAVVEQVTETEGQDSGTCQNRRNCIVGSSCFCLSLLGGCVLVVFMSQSSTTTTMSSTMRTTTMPSIISIMPTGMPSRALTGMPSSNPTEMLSSNPTEMISSRPTRTPSSAPTGVPSLIPSTIPSISSIPSTIPCKYFGADGSELRDAVSSYVEDNSEVSEIAQLYGWPIGNWCVDLVEDFTEVFSYNRDSALINFNEDISSWNTSSATTMRRLFRGANQFNQDISGWDVSKVEDMERMFSTAESFNQYIGAWNVSQVQNMNRMFISSRVFNQDIGSWDVSRVEDMEYMLSGTWAFDQDIGSWDVSRVKNMFHLFADARVFNQDLSAWNPSSAENMQGVFYLAYTFNQNLCAWGDKIRNVNNVLGMFDGADCPATEHTPELTAVPPGPFCYTCIANIVVDDCDNCDVECSSVRLTLTTDNYPGETSFSMINEETGATVWDVTGFEEPGVMNEYTSSICPTSCYNFLIEDSFGDGICCNAGEGGYILEYGGEVISAGGEFSSASSVYVGDCE